VWISRTNSFAIIVRPFEARPLLQRFLWANARRQAKEGGVGRCLDVVLVRVMRPSRLVGFNIGCKQHRFVVLPLMKEGFSSFEGCISQRPESSALAIPHAFWVARRFCILA
jgi:hypothetical protein